MSYLDVLQQLKRNELAPIYLLHGTESYFIQNIMKELKKKVLLDTDEENLSVYDLEETPIEEVITDAETYPFFGERKLIIANNPSFLKAIQDKISFEHHLESLERYLEQPVDYSVLVLIAPYEKMDDRKKLNKLLKKTAVIANCQPIKDKELRAWITNMADQLHILIADDAYGVFESQLATNLYLLQNELTKLATYIGEGGVITKEIAEELISHTADESSLRLVEAVIDRNLPKAIAIFKELEKMKEEPIGMIALLAYQFRIILRAKLLKKKGYNQFQIQKQLGAHPYVVKIAMVREQKFTVEQLEAVINLLADADRKMKQGHMEKGLIFELLLYNLIQINQAN